MEYGTKKVLKIKSGMFFKLKEYSYKKLLKL